MGRRAISIVALLLTAVSCTGGTSDGSTTTPTPGSIDTSAPAAPIDPGRLAVVDEQGDIVVMAPDGSERRALTERGENPAVYMQPIWSPSASWLAWGQATGTGFGIGIARADTGEVKTLTTPNLPFYTYWSPDNRHLGALHNGQTGVQFQIVDVEAETTELLDEDAPFYFSWNPAGDRVVTHAGVSRAETITPDDDRVELEPTAGNYLAPQWTDAGVFHVVDDHLVLEDAIGVREQVAEVSGLTMFVANPQGTMVAAQSTGGGLDGLTASTEDLPAVRTNAVVVVDVATRDTDLVDQDLALGFFWSADGGSLLVLTTSEDAVVPLVWSSEGQHEFPAYRPSRSMLRDTFPFFPQYAQSVSFWAPDSSAFAYAGTVEGESGVFVQDLDTADPVRVSGGSWVAWSPARP
jgi:TolB protein